MNYIGIDIGDGESCVCVLPCESDIEPRPLVLTGRKSFISAVAEDEDGKIVIGMDAIGTTAAKEFSVRFKSRYLAGDKRDLRDMQRFLQGLHDKLAAQGVLTPADKVVLGCPAGWNTQTREGYLAMIEAAGFQNVHLISESRAAFLYAKHAKTIQLAPELIESSALVIDIGSSTLDFAYVLDGRESNVGTFGDVYLGGGAIDEALLAAALDESPRKGEILRIFAEAPEWRSYCLLAARRVKEDYYSQQSEGKRHVRCSEMPVILYDMPIQLTIQANDQLMWRVVHQGIQALGGASFHGMLDSALLQAQKQTADRVPKVVLMTGGASRMGFFQELCAKRFPNSLLLPCEEPEFSIAKGLAYAGRVDEQILAFNAAIQEYLEAGSVQRAAQASMAGTINQVADMVTEIAYQQVVEAVERWHTGEYATLDELNRALPEDMSRVLEGPSLKEAIAGAMQGQMKQVCNALQGEIDDICAQYHVARSQMQLTGLTDLPKDAIQTQIDLKDSMAYLTVAVQTMITALVAGVMMLIPGGQLVDLAMIAAAAVAVLFGRDHIAGFTSSLKIPVFLRRQIPAKRLAGEELRKKMHAEFLRQLTADPALSSSVAASIEQGVAAHISRMAQKTEIAITTAE